MHYRTGPIAARRRTMLGITLLELMIVLVIVGILAAIGYPAYVGYSDRARRADGKALLMDAAARMERYYFDRNTYTTAITGNTGLGYVNGSTAPCAGVVCSAEKNYTLGAAACAGGTIATCYVLTATPNGNKPFVDSDCGNLTLDSRGTQGNSGPDSVDDCWGR